MFNCSLDYDYYHSFVPFSKQFLNVQELFAEWEKWVVIMIITLHSGCALHSGIVMPQTEKPCCFLLKRQEWRNGNCYNHVASGHVMGLGDLLLPVVASRRIGEPCEPQIPQGTDKTTRYLAWHCLSLTSLGSSNPAHHLQHDNAEQASNLLGVWTGIWDVFLRFICLLCTDRNGAGMTALFNVV